MATQQGINPLSFEAAGDLSTKQFTAVKSSGTNNRVTSVSATSDQVVGVLQNKPTAAGEPATVAVAGLVKWKAGGTVTAGNRVGVDSSGRCVAVGSGVASHGIVMEGCAVNEYAEVLLTPGGYAA